MSEHADTKQSIAELCKCGRGHVFRRHRRKICKQCHEEHRCNDSDLDCDDSPQLVRSNTKPHKHDNTSIYEDNVTAVMSDFEIRAIICDLSNKVEKALDIDEKTKILEERTKILEERREEFIRGKEEFTNKITEMDEQRKAEIEQIIANSLKTYEAESAELEVGSEATQKLLEIENTAGSMTAKQVRTVISQLDQANNQPVGKAVEIISKIHVPTDEEIKQQKKAEEEQAKRELTRNRLYQPTIASQSRKKEAGRGVANMTLKPQKK